MDEARRLETLLAYQILDTASEEGFDDLTGMAAEICETPISMISLVDRHRQWFKLKVGIDNQETPRAISFCAHALQSAGYFDRSQCPEGRAMPRKSDSHPSLVPAGWQALRLDTFSFPL